MRLRSIAFLLGLVILAQTGCKSSRPCGSVPPSPPPPPPPLPPAAVPTNPPASAVPANPPPAAPANPPLTNPSAAAPTLGTLPAFDPDRSQTETPARSSSLVARSR